MRLQSFARHVLVAIALALFAPPLLAQAGRVVGTVTDVETGQPIEGAQIFLRGTGLGAQSQGNGRYFIINVPPGTYTVVARRIGYGEQQVTNVSVLIDVTREINFRLDRSAGQLTTVKIEAQQVPLIVPGITGSSDAITAQELQSLPVQDIKGALSLQSGFLAVPDNTDILSYTDVRRGLEPVRIRGGRPAETLTLIDGIPINNFLFGGPALDLTTSAVQQIDFIRGGFEPQYGNALSGIINIAVREGTTDLRGNLEVQSSGIGGSLGSDYDELRDFTQVQGFLSGSVPATENRLRYMLAGRQQGGAARVLEFDDDIYNPLADERDENNNFNSVYDVFRGYRALGFNGSRDLTAKVAWYFTPVAKLTLTGVDFARQAKPYAFDWVQTGFDGYAACVNNYPDLEEQCRSVYNNGRTIDELGDLQDTNNENWYVRQASTHTTRRLYAANYNQTLGRLAFTATVGEFEQERNTCTYVSGVCLGTRMSYTYFQGPFVLTGGRSRNQYTPLFGTEELYGSDRTMTRVGRADVTWQATDHHNIQAGVFGQKHDVEFEEYRDVGLNNVVLQRSAFSARPWDAALYLQDRIEYDFLTVKLGFRFDYGKAPGRFFANPVDPTNGTTAREVCEGEATSLGATTPYSYTDTRGTPEEEDDITYTGLAACSLQQTLMDQATQVALQDDFEEAPSRSQFSPRIGLQFPLTQGSAVFFNFGRFAQNPALYDLYRGTGVGLENEGTPDGVSLQTPSGRRPLIGNPQLETEVATSYEVGYVSEFRQNYSIRVTAYNKNQNGLTGLGEGGLLSDGTRVNDPGATYKTASPNYAVLLNGDFQTARGVELQLRRRVTNFWGFDLNYAFSRVVTNAAPPELESQKREEGDPPARTRIRSETDQPHVFAGILRFQADRRAPGIAYVGRYLRNSSAAATFRIASGLPYTPDVQGVRRERNSGTGPATVAIDLRASKDWLVGNARLGTFVTVTNLLDRRNCMQVFASTGQCESGQGTSGRLEKARIGASYGATGTYSQAFDRPDYRTAPRAISGGLRLSF